MMDLIDREAALGCFWSYGDMEGNGYDETDMPAYDRLQALPIVKEVEDCISRQDVIDALRKLSQDDGYINLPHEYVTDAVRSLPSAQPTIMRSIGELVGYTGEPCPNCGRVRVERYESGLEICEKCNWCEQTKSYWLDGV